METKSKYNKLFTNFCFDYNLNYYFQNIKPKICAPYTVCLKESAHKHLPHES